MNLGYTGGRQVVEFRPSSRNDWTRQAACADPDSVLMFPDEWNKEAVAEAKAVCEQCPVREVCLDAAMDRGERFGVWGGLSAEERWSLHRQAVRKAARERSAAK